jgi:urease accessory protein
MIVQNPDKFGDDRSRAANPLESAAAVSAHIRFGRCAGNTVVKDAFATNPVKLFTTRGVTSTCWVCAANYGGGLVGGDAIRLHLELAAGTRAVLGTQASTKVYRSLRPASQHVTASVADDALLVLVPDPIVCFAHAHFSQQQRVDLDRAGNLVLVDWIASGRHASGERWAFRHYSSRLDVRREGRRILYDTLLLNQEDGCIKERLGAFDVCLTAIVTGPLVAAAAAAIVRGISERAIERGAPVVHAAWELPDGGALLRIVGSGGTAVEHVGTAVRQQLCFLSELLGDDPFSRKW